MIRPTIILLFIVFAAIVASAQQYTIKFASIAPEGSTWMNVMREYDSALRRESNGKLGFKIYAGAVQGEDKDVIRKIRLGQLHSAGLTGFGLGEIASKLRILDSPFLFASYGEVDHVYATLDKELGNALKENGFVLLGWAEVGFAHVFTNTPVRSTADMKGVKMWLWEGDPVAEATFKTFELSPTPLAITEVLTSLQTGLVNGVYASPLGLIALQWHTRVKYMMGLPLADASGAVVVSKKYFDGLPADLQEILVRNGKKYMQILTQKSRDENAQAVESLKKNGIQINPVTSPAAMKEYQEAGKKTRQSLVGKLYDQAFLDRVEKAVVDYRSTHSR